MDSPDLPSVVARYPIGTGLQSFRASFEEFCQSKRLVPSAGVWGGLDDLSLDLLSALQGLRAPRQLPSRRHGKNLLDDLSALTSSINTTGASFRYGRLQALLKAVLSAEPDEQIWKEVDNVLTESTPPPGPFASSTQETPWLRNTGSFANSSERRKYVDDVLRSELGQFHVGLPDFEPTFFGCVSDLATTSDVVFLKCKEAPEPLFHEGWTGWPSDANQDDVLRWLTTISNKLAVLAQQHSPRDIDRRALVAMPNTPLHGSVGKRKLDVGLVRKPTAKEELGYHWSDVLVPGELKNNPAADKASEAWLDLGRYAREVLRADDTRRYVLGFTLCGSRMRLWEFDRLGGIASDQFDIHRDGRRFVSAVIGYLWMSREELGFDPTIKEADGRRYIEINKDGVTERLVLDELLERTPCVAGRATTCWRAHLEGKPDEPLVVKDSWQYPEREEEGDLLREVTAKGVANVARYYYHGTVRIAGMDDDVRNNVRRGIDITKAQNSRSVRHAGIPSETTPSIIRSSEKGVKRSSSQTGAPMPPGKRRSGSPNKADSNTLLNRIRRRLVMLDYGRPIFTLGSRVALLGALQGGITGHEALYEAGILHRDISVNNIMSSERAFLIDLDLAIRIPRDGVTGARGKTGTLAFMAIGALLGEQHSFMHDLESFFWVLFWICIHYEKPNQGRVVARFDKWNFSDTKELAGMKLGVVADGDIFRQTIEEHFTQYHQPMIPWVEELRKVVFPDGARWKRVDKGLYGSMKRILLEAQKDPKLVAGL
ncbi:hypothetical protein JX266_013876 [Neoarthrinium moseri]|nr:hypothetical protein JX266_013876 [Neoarthrinium moseri]